VVIGNPKIGVLIMVKLIIIAISLTFFMFLFIPGIMAGILITEVGFKDSPEWAELHNDSASGVDISGYILTDLDGTDNTPLSGSAATLQSEGYAVVYFTSGTDETDATKDTDGDGILDLYLSGETLSNTDDQMALKNSSGNLIDAVCWSDNNTTVSQYELGDVQDLATASQWPNATTPAEFNSVCYTDSDDIGSSESLTRYRNEADTAYVDTNTKNDWIRNGMPSPGTENDQTLAVQLSEFRAILIKGKITLIWKTETEVSNLGWYIYGCN